MMEATTEKSVTNKTNNNTIKNRVSIKIVSFLILFLLASYFALLSIFPNLNYNQQNIKFNSIIDNDEIANHLKKLNLTPNHSIQILSTDATGLTKQKLLHGRFLHITDMHPDELNIIHSAIRRKCHQIIKNLKANSDMSHKYGDALSGCDSPINLYEETLAWVKENLKDHIDFVIWTGDNIRHDNDRLNPRTEMDIFDMNERVANDFANTFMDDDEATESPFNRRVKIIPSLGNNDVYPHNLFAPGPTLQTRELYKIWRNFIPPEQMHTFDRGAYFFREVIPGKLVVISINTLYWFQSNPLNDNCDGRKQPGYKLFLWLGATLKECRRRGLKVWLSGHVPPIPKNIHHSCYSKISVWMHEYRDLIIGGVWGHMNIDHWVPLDSVKAWRSIEKRLLSPSTLNENDQVSYINYDELNSTVNGMKDCGDYDGDYDDDDDIDGDFETVEDLYRSLGFDLEDETNSKLHLFSDRYLGAPNGKVKYLETLRDTMYSKLKGKKKSGEFFERYSIAHISASVIPTFNPGMRVWEYNVTEFQNLNVNVNGGGIKSLFSGVKNWFYGDTPYVFEEGDWKEFFTNLELELDKETIIEILIEDMENDLESIKSKDYIELTAVDKTIPNLMPKGLRLGPAYIPQTFTPEKYTQYYIDLNEVNYGGDKGQEDKTWKFGYKSHYSTDEHLDSLLVSDWIRFGRKLAKSASAFSKASSPKSEINENDLSIQTNTKKLWNSYIDRAFISSNYQSLDDAY